MQQGITLKSNSMGETLMEHRMTHRKCPDAVILTHLVLCAGGGTLQKQVLVLK